MSEHPGISDPPPPPGSRALFWAAALLWLPAGVVASAAIRFGPTAVSPGDLLTAMAMASSSLVVASVCGLPLALACRRLGRLGHRRLAWIGGAVLGVATVAASILAGLFGPLGIAVAALVLSAPVWIAVVWRSRQARADDEEERPPLDGPGRRP